VKVIEGSRITTWDKHNFPIISLNYEIYYDTSYQRLKYLVQAV